MYFHTFVHVCMYFNTCIYIFLYSYMHDFSFLGGDFLCWRTTKSTHKHTDTLIVFSCLSVSFSLFFSLMHLSHIFSLSLPLSLSFSLSFPHSLSPFLTFSLSHTHTQSVKRYNSLFLSLFHTHILIHIHTLTHIHTQRA